MKFIETNFQGLFIIEIEPHADTRGCFARVWCQDEFRRHGLETRVVQCNLAYNHRRGTLRGMHFQAPPHEEIKIVRCVRGAVYDVAVDLRPSSRTYLQWLAVELTADNRRCLYLPAGFAHGYQTIVDEAEIFYQVSEAYHPQAERGVRWDDPIFSIHWPTVGHRIISEKDLAWPDFEPQPPAGRTPVGGKS
ncbi:MAG: dTDP-4-dehydrorhamnose 3,5-epimerase [Phycisphaerae bacterium]|nr:dTDP-4-dehydrorhamnose 3,5-epimerase [Phycisphaerae bacterium]